MQISSTASAAFLALAILAWAQNKPADALPGAVGSASESPERADLPEMKKSFSRRGLHTEDVKSVQVGCGPSKKAETAAYGSGAPGARTPSAEQQERNPAATQAGGAPALAVDGAEPKQGGAMFKRRGPDAAGPFGACFYDGSLPAPRLQLTGFEKLA